MTTSVYTPADATAQPLSRPAVQLTNVDLVFTQKGSPSRKILSNLTFEAPSGQFVALIGASGCGKTTILNLVSALMTPTAGTVSVFGRPPQVGRADVGYMFARDALLPWRTARQNVELGLEIRGVSRKDRKDRATALLEKVHLGPAMDKYPAELSQGMRQRTALARTWATSPELLLMDEPFAALDAQTRTSVRDGFLEIWDDEDQRKTVLFVTHDLSEALVLADRIVTIAHGKILTDVIVPFDRPRDQRDLLGMREYQELYDRLAGDLILT
ncbi:ABC transporter ATP-binding protein [Rhodococcus sp. NPDC055024]